MAGVGLSHRRSQSGGLGKDTGRNMTRTMQRRNRITPSGIAGRDGRCGGRLNDRTREPGIGARIQRVGASAPPAYGRRHVWKAQQRKEGRSRGVPRRSRTAKARRISGWPVKSPRAGETDGWGRSKRRRIGTTQPEPEPRTPRVARHGLSHSGSWRRRRVWTQGATSPGDGGSERRTTQTRSRRGNVGSTLNRVGMGEGAV